jgi:SET domain-containing protein
MQKVEKSYFITFYHHDAEYVVDSYNSSNISRFINHSCDPNATIWTVASGQNNLQSFKLSVFALRDISMDEEITVNYKECLVGIADENAKCLCESKNCKKFIYADVPM